MRDRFFLDTNIFIYLFVGDFNKKERSKEVVEEALKNRNGIISTQVIQEFLNVGVRRNINYLEELRTIMNSVLFPLCLIYPSYEYYELAMDIQKETKYSFYDSLIIAGAIKGDCRYLLSEDMQSGHKIRGLEIVNPYLPGFSLID